MSRKFKFGSVRQKCGTLYIKNYVRFTGASHKFVIKALLHKTKCFILLTVTWGSTIKRTHCCISSATMVTRRRHNVTLYRGADKSLTRPGRKQANVSVRMAWISFGALPCRKKNKHLMTARVSMLLKSRASLTCFRACFLPGRAKDLSSRRYFEVVSLKSRKYLPYLHNRLFQRADTRISNSN